MHAGPENLFVRDLSQRRIQTGRLGGGEAERRVA